MKYLLQSLKVKSADRFLDIIDKADAEQGIIDRRLTEMGKLLQERFKILAVTSCPTGIAHTYMAAEGIEKAAEKRLFREDRDERLGRSEKRSYKRKRSRSGLYCGGRRASSDRSFDGKKNESSVDIERNQ